MARANAASVPARAGSLQGLARALAQPAQLRMAAAGHAIRRLVPALVAVFLVFLTAGVWLQVTQAREKTIQDAITDLELVGVVAATQVDAALAADPGRRPETLMTLVPERAAAIGRQILVADMNGILVAAQPSLPQGAALQSLSDRLGPAQPLTILGEKAGVLRLTLPDGTDAFATVRTLHAPLGQLAVVDTADRVLGEWWSATLRAAIVLCATMVAVTAIAMAYLWQSGRASDLEDHYQKVHGRIDTALNRGRCGLWDWDLARGRVYWSESMYAILGMQPRNEFVSFGDINALVHPLDDDLTALAERLAAAQAQVIDHVFRLRNALGAWVWLRVRAELVRERASSEPYLVGIAVDITDEKRLAERSAAADRRLSDAIEAIPESFALWDSDGQLVTCNAKYTDFHQLDDTMFPSGSRQLERVATTPPFLEAWQTWPEPQSPAATEAAWSREVQLRDERWVQISERPTKDGGLVAVGTDITPLKRHEVKLMDSERRLMATVADLRRSRQALELQARELAEMAERHLEKKAEAEAASRVKSEFLAKMSHEFRTPLNAIIGFSELMCTETFGPLGSDKYAGYAADIRSSGEAILALITDVLEMSRLEAGRVRLCRSLFPIDDTIAAALASIEQQAAVKGLRVDVKTTPGCFLHADRMAVEKVLQTILANACKFTADGGAIAVRARSQPGGLNIFVADDGVGVAPGAIARLGRPFEQIDTVLRNGMKGSGLGLAIARSLTELHGGSLRLKSRLGEGTVVMVHFPTPPEDQPRTGRRPMSRV